MKKQFWLGSSARPIGWQVIGMAVVALVGGSQMAQAQFSLGDAANYAVLDEGAGNNQLSINDTPMNWNGTNYSVYGNVGLGNLLGGDASAAINNGVIVLGSMNFANATANWNGSGGSFTFTGGTNLGVAQVDTDLGYLNTLSTNVGNYSGTALTLSLSGSGSTQTVSAATGNLVNGNRVFTLQSGSQFNANTTLIINGNAANNSVIINVPASFGNVSFNGAILLEGGLTPNQVLINILGGSPVTLSGGDTLQTSGNNAWQWATFLDPFGDVTTSAVNIVGHIYGGDDANMQLVSGTTIYAAVPEPQTWALVALGLAGLLVTRRGRAIQPR